MSRAINKSKRLVVSIIADAIGIYALFYIFNHTFSIQTQPWRIGFFLALLILSIVVLAWNLFRLFLRE